MNIRNRIKAMRQRSARMPQSAENRLATALHELLSCQILQWESRTAKDLAFVGALLTINEKAGREAAGAIPSLAGIPTDQRLSCAAEAWTNVRAVLKDHGLEVPTFYAKVFHEK